jgi:hypothetical protein
MDAKFYAATQVIDEARHVEAYSRLLHEKFQPRVPDHADAEEAPRDVLSDSRWDMTYLGMQVLIEGLALAAFAQIRDQAQNPLAAAVNAYVMQDEARHVAFGRLALRDFYPQLTAGRARPSARSSPSRPATRCATASRPRRSGRPRPARRRVRRVHERVGLHAALPHAPSSPHRPRDEGHRPLGHQDPQGLRDMSILGYAEVDLQDLASNDERVAEDFDARKAEISAVARSVA